MMPSRNRNAHPRIRVHGGPGSGPTTTFNQDPGVGEARAGGLQEQGPTAPATSSSSKTQDPGAAMPARHSVGADAQMQPGDRRVEQTPSVEEARQKA